MFENMDPQIKEGIGLWLGFTFLVLLLFRLTRNSKVQKKIQYPLILLFGLATFFDVFYISGRPISSAIAPYFFAVLYLTITILALRLGSHIFFDFFLIRIKKYQPPRLLKEITVTVIFTLVTLGIVQHTLKIQITTLLATSALITVVLGLALQETLGNLFAGVSLHMDPPYKPGEWIRVGEISGKVEEITWRATKLQTVNNDYVIIPNGQIAKEKLINHSYPRIPHANSVYIGISYNTPPNFLDKVVQEALATVPNVSLNPPPDTRLLEFKEFSAYYQIKFWYHDHSVIEPTMSQVRKALWYHLRRNGIDIPYPIRNVYLHDQEEEAVRGQNILQKLSDSLQKIEVFSWLEEDERMMVARQLQQLTYASDEVIIREGEVDESFFIIDHGEVEVYLVSAGGNKKTLNQLSDGDFFGEMALLTGQRRTANVRAMTDVVVHRLDKEAFKEVLEKKPEMLDAISSVLCRRKDQLEMLMAESSGPHSDELSMNMGEVKNRILSRLRGYFGL